MCFAQDLSYSEGIVLDHPIVFESSHGYSTLLQADLFNFFYADYLKIKSCLDI